MADAIAPPSSSTAPTSQTSSNQPPSAFAHQIAGHAGGITLLPNGHLQKSAVSRELEFYQAAQHSSHSQLRAFLPVFYGVETKIDEEGEELQIIEIENLLKNYSKPSIIDIKIGTRLWSEDASADKRARMEEQARVTTSFETGLRICGMKVCDV